MDRYYHSDNLTLLHGNSLEVLKQLPDGIVHTCVTSPPYWALRDYGTATWEGGDAACDHKQPAQPRADRPMGKLHGGTDSVNAQDTGARAFKDKCGLCGAVRHDDQLGLERTPEAYVENMVAVFREVRRVLRDDGTCWVNIGDSYSSGKRETAVPDSMRTVSGRRQADGKQDYLEGTAVRPPPIPGVKPKDMFGIPWMLAFGLRADGWHLRSDIIWAKPNGMPESVTDRPTKSHEHIFLLSKKEDYYYDADAIREPHSTDSLARFNRNSTADGSQPYAMAQKPTGNEKGANKRDVWVVTTRGTYESHFAAFPPDLIKPCILAGAPVGGVVLDCFAGTGIAPLTAKALGRRGLGIDLSTEFLDIAAKRDRKGRWWSGRL